MIDLSNKYVILMIIFKQLMNKELESFDIFVDDIISSQENLLKGELDFLLMQHIFESLELDNFQKCNKSFNSEDYTESYLVA